AGGGGGGRRDGPRCRLGDRRRDVLNRSRAAGWDLCVVVDDDDVVLGVVTESGDAADPDALVEQTMQSAPLTFRPHMTLDEATESLNRHSREHALVTTAAGRLIGVLTLADAQRRRTR